MNTRTRIRKEVRQLQWPWLLIAVAAILSTRPPSSTWSFYYDAVSWAFLTGIFVGIPLLASLPAGYEFEHRTMALLLAQPIERAKLWREKHLVAAIGILPVALIFFLSPMLNDPDDPRFWITAVLWMVTMSAAATFWTMLAKSTLGGLVLNTAANVLLLVGWTYLADRLRAAKVLNGTVTAAAIVLFVCYAVTMVWLGRRAFLRQQAVEGLAAEDAFGSMLRFIVPPTVREWLPCRPTSPTLNLLRREFWLLRPVWIFGLVNTLAWICLLLLHQVPRKGHEASVAVIVLIVVSPLSAILAGAMSMGEEKTLGTHLWHMTLPISIAKQWILKLVVAIVAGVVCSTGSPILVLSIAGSLAGGPMTYFGDDPLWLWLLAAAGISLMAFWCSCIVKGTVRAALWMMLVCIALMITATLAARLGYRLYYAAELLMSRLYLYLDPFRFGPSTFSRSTFLFRSMVLVVSAFMVLQSYRLFRAQRQDSTRSIVVSMLPLFVVILVISSVLWIPDALGGAAREQQYAIFDEIHAAIEAVQASLPNPNPTHPIQLSADDLAKAAPLSSVTRRWLANDAVTLEPHAELKDFRDCCRQYYSYGEMGAKGSEQPYIAQLHLRNGLVCQMFYSKTTQSYGRVGAECK